MAFGWTACWTQKMTEQHGYQPDSTDPAAENITDAGSPRPAQPECQCAPHCAACHEPLGQLHFHDCDWQPRRHPHLSTPPKPAVVQDTHRHVPGCAHAQARPWALFVQVSQCVVCGAIDTEDSQVVPSFGGTTEYFSRCTNCDTQWSAADLSAII